MDSSNPYNILHGVLTNPQSQSKNRVKVNLDTIETPLGPMTAAATSRGLRMLCFDSATREGRDAPFKLPKGWERDPGTNPILRQTTEELVAYFEGTVERFSIPLDPQGSDFQKRVWAIVAEIPYGAVWTYGAVAEQAGDIRAARAVGRANAANPIPILIPCHRVVGAKGALTGYGGGIERKRWLLRHEAHYGTGGPIGRQGFQWSLFD